MNEVNLCWAQFVLGWVTVFGRVYRLSMYPARSTQTCIPPGLLSRVPALVGVRVGMSLLPGVIPYGMWVLVTMRLVANCYSPFTLPHLYQFFLFLAGAAHQTRLGDQWRPPDLLVDAFGVSMSSPVFKYGHLATLDSMIPVSSMEEAHTHTRLTAIFPGLPRWVSTRKTKPIWILLKQETVSGSGISWAICKSAPCSSQTTPPFLQAGWPSCRPTNSVKALKA